jgi:hypothetical protein
MLSHATNRMGMMVLDTDCRQFFLAVRIPGARVVRVQVMCQEVRLYAQERLEVAGYIYLVQLGVPIIKVADMLA